MDYRHREVIKKYSSSLQPLINLCALEDSLRKSKIFTSLMLKDIYDGKASFFEELPTRGPNAFFRFIDLLKANGHTAIAEELCHAEKPDYQVPLSSSHNHGYFLVISNYEFEGMENPVLKRGYTLEASSFDSALQNNFVNHEYKVNLEANELYSELKKFSEIVARSDVHSCIVIILSSGIKSQDSKAIYGRDGKYVFLHDILNLFSDTNCPSLKYKPKIFLLPSFEASNASLKIIKLSSDVNDTFLWHFPPLKIYKHAYDVRSADFFGEILSKNLRLNLHKSDFETILISSHSEFIEELKKKNLNVDLSLECERLGFCREKIIFTVNV